MIYVGMDVSSKSFVIYAQDRKKKKGVEGAIAPSREALRKFMKELGDDNKYVVFEAEQKWIALLLKKMKGVHLHVVHPNEVKWIGASNGKTDKIDARKLSDLARGDLLPRAVHVVEGSVRELRELISARGQLQSKRISLMNTTRAYMLQEGYKLPEKFFNRVDAREKIEKLPVAKAQNLELSLRSTGNP